MLTRQENVFVCDVLSEILIEVNQDVHDVIPLLIYQNYKNIAHNKYKY